MIDAGRTAPGASLKKAIPDGSDKTPQPTTDFARLKVKVTQGKVFGPQPFLAIQTKKNRFMHDNFDFSENTNTWHYAFHADTISIEDVLKIGVAANDKLGNTCIKKISFKN